MVFVLAQVGETAAEPIVTSDLHCGTSQNESAIVDTLVLSGDGVARRATTMIRTVNGVEQQRDSYSSPGLWAAIRGPNINY